MDVIFGVNIGKNITRTVTKRELINMIEDMYGKGNENDNNVIAVITETRTQILARGDKVIQQSVTFALPFILD